MSVGKLGSGGPCTSLMEQHLLCKAWELSMLFMYSTGEGVSWSLQARNRRPWASGRRKLPLLVFPTLQTSTLDWRKACHPSEPHPVEELCQFPWFWGLGFLTWLCPCQTVHIHSGLPLLFEGGKIHILRVYIYYRKPTIVTKFRTLLCLRAGVLPLTTYFLQEWQHRRFLRHTCSVPAPGSFTTWPHLSPLHLCMIDSYLGLLDAHL